MKTRSWAIALVLLTTLLTSSAQLMLKLGVTKSVFLLPRPIISPYLMVGLAFYAIGMALAIISFRHGKVSVLYPVFATSYVWVSLLSYYFLGEKLNLLKWIGVSAIICGICIIGLKDGKNEIGGGNL